MSAGCAICAIPDSELIAQTASSKAFFPAKPIAPAHIVVAVREHRPSLHDLSDAQAADVLVLARRIAEAVRSPAELEKFYTAAVGDVDLHFHLHLLPRESTTPGLGPFIFGSGGWAGQELTSVADGEASREMIRGVLLGLDLAR